MSLMYVMYQICFLKSGDLKKNRNNYFTIILNSNNMIIKIEYRTQFMLKPILCLLSYLEFILNVYFNRKINFTKLNLPLTV